MDHHPALEARELTVRYGERVALDAVSVAFGAGELVGLIGTSGAGKSTLLAALSGAIASTSGEVFARGVCLTGAAMPRFANSGVASLTLAGGGAAAASLLIRLEQVLRCASGSAAASATPPRVVLLDEVVAGSDAGDAERVDHLVQRLRDELGVTLIRATPLGRQLMPGTDRAIVLRDGRKVADGMPREVAREVERLHRSDPLLLQDLRRPIGPAAAPFAPSFLPRGP